MSDLASRLAGVSGILVTPFDDEDRLAPERQAPIVDAAVAAGVHLLTANGNTGEFYSLTVDEAETMLAATAAHVAGRVPLISGVGRSVQDACRLARASAACGAAALMVHQPPDPFVSPRGLGDYVRRIIEAGDGLPVVLYLRNDAIGTDAIAALCALEGVIGVKWATPNPMRLKAAMEASPGTIAWVGGLAEIWAPVFNALGARGFTSGLVNIWPERSVEISAALAGGDHAAVSRLVGGMRLFEDIRAEEQNGINVSAIKAALRMMGHDCGAARPPAGWPLDSGQLERLGGFLRQAGLCGDARP